MHGYTNIKENCNFHVFLSVKWGNMFIAEREEINFFVPQVSENGLTWVTVHLEPPWYSDINEVHYVFWQEVQENVPSTF